MLNITTTDLLPADTFLTLLDQFQPQMPDAVKQVYPQFTTKWVLKVSHGLSNFPPI